jgi:hypothetical protein
MKLWCPAKGAALPRLTPDIPLFNQQMAGNNSGALLLTKARFTIMARPLLATIR